MNNNRRLSHRVGRVFCQGFLLPLAVFCAAASAASAPDSPKNAVQPVKVETRALKEVAIYPQRDVAASVQARNESKLASEVAGTVLRWTADTGVSVRRGEVLAEIDPADFRLALDRARSSTEASASRLKLAESQLRRSQSLVEKGFISQEALAQRETEVSLMRAELASNRAQQATAERQLAKTKLRAPFDAHVKERKAQAGETVAAGTVLYLLAESGASELAASVPPADVASLRAAKEPRFEAQGARYPVRLLRVGETLTAPARTQEARFAFTGEMPAAGTDGRLIWNASQPYLPATVIVRRGSVLGVFVAEGDKVRFVPLPEAQEARAAAVPAVVGGDARIVVGGHAALQDGMAIRP